MKTRASAAPIALLYFVSFSAPCGGQQTPASAGQPLPGSDVEHGIGLPPWLRLGLEFRGRAEADLDPDQDRDERFYLNRIRLSATVQPYRWVRFFVQGQDARALSFAGAGADAQRNPVELHQGYVELGRAEQGWQLRFGRQELAIGDERLVAADSYWDWFGQAFDTVRVAYGQHRWRVDTFAGFRVEPAARHVNPFDPASRIAGVTGTIQAHGGTVQPYLVWKRGEEIQDLMLRPGHKDVAALGVLWRGNLPRNLDFDVEMALERGHVVRDSISAWA